MELGYENPLNFLLKISNMDMKIHQISSSRMDMIICKTFSSRKGNVVMKIHKTFSSRMAPTGLPRPFALAVENFSKSKKSFAAIILLTTDLGSWFTEPSSLKCQSKLYPILTSDLALDTELKYQSNLYPILI